MGGLHYKLEVAFPIIPRILSNDLNLLNFAHTMYMVLYTNFVDALEII